MLFNSLGFLAFFVVVFAVHWGIGGRRSKVQDLTLLGASLFFYGWTDLRFLALLLTSATVNYVIGIQLEQRRNTGWSTLVFWIGIAVNLGLLVYFKYFNFFYASYVDVVNLAGGDMVFTPLQVLLPLGVSFFTFQIIGYLIDVRNEEIQASRAPIAFFTYIFFFPKMLAGPIERAQHFLHQLEKPRVFEAAKAVDACRQILWGLFAKVVIADGCGRLVDPIFDEHASMSGTTLLLGAFLYFLQIYADFSGYSNIALGTARLLGIELMRNFAAPLFVTNIADFWRRWHISLSSWMMDYVFTPLSFILRAHGKAGVLIALSLTFITVGIWHGANWTFVLFGVIQCLYFAPLVLSGRMAAAQNDGRITLSRAAAMVGMFVLMSLTFVLLRSETTAQAFGIWSRIFSPSLLSGLDDSLKDPKQLLAFLGIFCIVEWSGRKELHAIKGLAVNKPVAVRWLMYWAIALAVILLGSSGDQFIYQQF